MRIWGYTFLRVCVFVLYRWYKVEIVMSMVCRRYYLCLLAAHRRGFVDAQEEVYIDELCASLHRLQPFRYFSWVSSVFLRYASSSSSFCERGSSRACDTVSLSLPSTPSYYYSRP